MAAGDYKVNGLLVRSDGAVYTTTTANMAALAASSGSSLVGFIQSGNTAKTYARTAQDKERDIFSLKDYKNTDGTQVLGDGSRINTTGITNAVSEINALTTSFTPTNGAAIGYGPALWVPYGRYKINDAVPYFGYTKIYGAAGAIIEQTDTTKDHFTSTSAFDNEFDGLKFVGGRYAIYIENPNTDYTRFRVNRCEFQVTSDYAIYSKGTGGIQISGNLTINECGFLNCKKVLRNAFDGAYVRDSWVEYTSGPRMDANTAVFYNAFGVLTLDSMFGIPNLTAPRPATVRWIDNYGSSVVAKNSRFGGEESGMPIIYNFKAPEQVYPWTGGAVIIIEDSLCAAGPNPPVSSSDNGVIHFRTEIPQMVKLKNNRYPTDSNLLVNSGGTITMATYLSGQHANVRFIYDLGPNLSRGAALGVSEMEPHLVGTFMDSNTDMKAQTYGQRTKATGAALVAGDIALSAGWGATASVSAISGKDQRFRFTITSAGAGQAANPTATLTFKDGSWNVAPFAVVSRNGGNQPAVLPTWTTTTTTLVITFPGTPVAAETYTFEGVVLG